MGAANNECGQREVGDGRMGKFYTKPGWPEFSPATVGSVAL